MWTVQVDVAYSFTQQNISFMNLCPHVCCSNTILHFPCKAPSPDRFVPDWPAPELPELAWAHLSWPELASGLVA